MSSPNRQSSPGTVLLLCIVVGMFLTWAIGAANQGSLPTAVVAVAAAAWWTLPIWTRKAKRRAFARGTYSADGTVIRPDRHLENLCWLVVAGGAAVWGAFGVLAAQHLLVIPGPIGDSEFGHSITSPLLFCAMALVLAAYTGRMIQLRGMSWLRLTHDGFKFAEVFWSHSGSWDEVVSVSDQAPGTSGATSPLAIKMRTGKPAIMRDSAVYAGPDGDALFELVHYYWTHPKSRIELTDGLALERLRARTAD